ncbi:MAG TPA: endonuclease III [Anaerolineae bacterium]|nr:endonuclease III [Anaerolineae bacterium]
MSDIDRYEEAVRIIEASFEPYFWSKTLSPFEVLISTILSQKTERRGTKSAFDRLRSRIGTTPEELAAANLLDIVDAIRPAGLYRSKAPKIKEIARLLLDKYSGDLSRILNLPTDEARKELIGLPGVGPKTADILLSFVGKRPVFPVDVHIERVAKRLGLVPEKARYEEIRVAYERIILPDDRMRAHMAIIEFGREICTARNPKHGICPVSQYCDYYKGLLFGS